MNAIPQHIAVKIIRDVTAAAARRRAARCRAGTVAANRASCMHPPTMTWDPRSPAGMVPISIGTGSPNSHHHSVARSARPAAREPNLRSRQRSQTAGSPARASAGADSEKRYQSRARTASRQPQNEWRNTAAAPTDDSATRASGNPALARRCATRASDRVTFSAVLRKPPSRPAALQRREERPAQTFTRKCCSRTASALRGIACSRPLREALRRHAAAIENRRDTHTARPQ